LKKNRNSVISKRRQQIRKRKKQKRQKRSIQKDLKLKRREQKNRKKKKKKKRVWSEKTFKRQQHPEKTLPRTRRGTLAKRNLPLRRFKASIGAMLVESDLPSSRKRDKNKRKSAQARETHLQ